VLVLFKIKSLNCKIIKLHQTRSSLHHLQSDNTNNLSLAERNHNIAAYEVIDSSEKVLVDNVLYTECQTLQSARKESQEIYNKLYSKEQHVVSKSNENDNYNKVVKTHIKTSNKGNSKY